MRKKRPATSARLGPTSRGERPAPAPATHQVPWEARSISSPGRSPKNPSKKPTCPSRGREGGARRGWWPRPGPRASALSDGACPCAMVAFPRSQPPAPQVLTASPTHARRLRQATPKSELWSGRAKTPRAFSTPLSLSRGGWHHPPECWAGHGKPVPATLCVWATAPPRARLCHTVCLSVCLSVFTKATFT